MERKERSHALLELAMLNNNGSVADKNTMSQAMESKCVEKPSSPTKQSTDQTTLEKIKPFFMVQNYEQVPLHHEFISIT